MTRLGILIAVAAICGVVMAVMLATGYVPLNSFGHNVAHYARFALAVGVGVGCMLAVLLEAFGEAS